MGRNNIGFRIALPEAGWKNCRPRKEEANETPFYPPIHFRNVLRQMRNPGNMFRTVFMLVLIVSCAATFADVRLPNIFSDGMVLQRDMPVPVWGWGQDGEKVSVEFNGQSKSTAVKDGRWRVDLDPMPACATAQVLTVKGSNTVQIKDVLVGDVWFTAGQSNMMMGLGSAAGGAEALKRIEECPNLRAAIVPSQNPPPTEPLADISKPVAWSRPTSGYSAVSGMFAEKLYRHMGGKVPVGMITAVEIVPAESWVDAATLSAAPELQHLLKSPLGPSKCFNCIIAPLGPFALRGVLYYQGEYNGGRGAEYRSLLPALIRSWRKSFAQPDLPFLFVQLPGFQEHRAGKDVRMDMDSKTLAGLHKGGERHAFIEVREAQLLTWRSVPRTGMAITIDVGDAWDIHPANKEPVADRLLLQAREVAYGEKLVASGPVPCDVKFGKGDVEVRFDYVGSGLVGRGPGGAVLGFDLAGSDLRFHPAQARIEGDRVIVSCPEVPVPSMLHYAWAGYPQCTLFNREGLPATPFRSCEPSRLPMVGETHFEFRNQSFEQPGATPQAASEWGAQGEPLREEEKASDGKAAVLLNGKHAGVKQEKIAVGAGYAWNSDPLREQALRPGCVIGYAVDIAAGPGDGVATGYMRLCQDPSAGGSQAWGIPLISTAGETFARRHVAHRLSGEQIQPGDTVGALFANHDGKRPVYLDNFSELTVLRPLLKLDHSPIDLGKVGPGATAASKQRSITNGQARTLPQQLRDGDAPSQVATILYGLAGAAPNGWRHLQVLSEPADHVGAIIIGKDAGKFEFVSDHCVDSRRKLKLVGDDGQPGLLGGQNPEAERFSVRFLGSDKTGEYQAAIRVVTQAGNVGFLSQAGNGEPPVNLYYLDIPVTVKVNP